VVTTLVDENGTGPACSLREAILAANTDSAVGGCSAGAGADTITFASGVTGTITLMGTLPATGGALAIQGPGAGSLTISGGGAVGLFQVNPIAQLWLTGLTLANGQSLIGGAIENNNGALTITNSTLSGNRAADRGGAIDSRAGTVTITNSTLSGNQASVGGAIDSYFDSLVTITNSTIAANQSGSSPVLAVDSGTATSLHNVVLANPSPSCGGGGAITDQGGNIASDATCPVTTMSSRNNTDPLLGPLQNNGGPTQTMALLTGSPAIDAGVDCPPPDTDQRGVTRPQGAACDSGAYELEPVTLTGAKTCTRTSVTTAVCELALTINPPTSGTNSLTVTTDTGSFGAVTVAGSPVTCSPGVLSAAGPAAVTFTLPAGCSGVTLSETLFDLPVGAVAVTQTATLAGPDGATGTFTATLGTAPPQSRPPMEEILGFRRAAGLRLSCPPLASVRQIVTCTVVPVDAAGNAAVTAPGVIEVSSLAGGLVTASGTRSTNLRIPCGGPVQAPPTLGTPIDPNTCRGVTFQVAATGVGVVEVRARYEPDSAGAAAGIDELETVATVTFVAG